MHFDENGTRAKNCETNSYGGPVQSNEPVYAGTEIQGVTGSYPWVRQAEDDDFVQTGNLYRLVSEEEKQRLVVNIAGGLAQMSWDDFIDRSTGHFRNADPDSGAPRWPISAGRRAAS